MARKLLRFGDVTELDPLLLTRVCGGNDKATAMSIRKKLDGASPADQKKWDACMMANQPAKDVDDIKPAAAWRVLLKCSRETLGWK